MKNSALYGIAAVVLVVAVPVFAAPPTLDKIKASGVIVVGQRESSTPFSYIIDPQQPAVGYSMDICMKIVDAVKAKVGNRNIRTEYKTVTSANRIPLIKDGSVDIECGSTTNNLDRQKEVAFSVTTFVAATRLVAKKSNRVRMMFDLRGKPVVSTAGSTPLKQVVQFNERYRTNMNILQGKDHGESFSMVEDGRAVAFAMDDILLSSLIANSKNPSDYTLSIQALSIEPYGIMLRRDDREFKKLVDETVIGLFKSGEIRKIYNKWFTSPIPPKGINLNVPMGDILDKVIKNPTDSGNPAHYH
jgi:glutamate/aspartate transport system substrate-binding protein